MPKATKKKKEKKADFAKAKLKLGKGKQAASNATNTTITAKTISLPSQSLGHSTAEATTKRGHSLQDLCTLLKHYAAASRKDGLSGLKELYSSHPQLLQTSISTLLPLLARLIGDDDQSVRKAVQPFLVWYLSRADYENLAPTLPTLIALTLSYLSHIYIDVRLDAVRALDIILESVPATSWAPLTDGSGQSLRLLHAYLALLGIATASQTQVSAGTYTTDMPVKSKLLILASLARFLEIILFDRSSSDTSQSATLWFFASSFRSISHFKAFAGHDRAGEIKHLNLLDDSPIEDSPNLHFSRSSSLLGEADNVLSDFFGEPTSEKTTALSSCDPASLLVTLSSILLSAFLDSAPTAFSPDASTISTTPAEIALDAVVAVISLTRTLWRATVINANMTSRARAFNAVTKLSDKFATYFPFTNSGQTSLKTQTKIDGINTAYSEIVALALHSSNNRRAEESASKALGKLTKQVDQIQQHLRQLLIPANVLSVIPTKTQLTAEAYVALLPTVWPLLCSLSTDLQAQGELFELLLDHFASLGAGSAVKRSAFCFISQVSMLQDNPAYTGAFSFKFLFRKTPTTKAKWEAWVQSLPSYIVKLGPQHHSTVQSIFKFLQHLAITLDNAKWAESMPKLLVPLFETTFASYSAEVQKTASECAWWWIERNAASSTELKDVLQVVMGEKHAVKNLL